MYILEDILRRRTTLMGIAIILVLVFHFFCWVYNPIGGLNIGYIGVDIFLFLSGLGLAYSYEKNSISKFYKNRLLRIYPIYFIGVILTYIIFNLNWSATDLLANLTTIGYYSKLGVNRYDWYLESLFTLYIFFPIFYFIGKGRYVALILLFSLCAVILFLLKGSIPWYYDCLIGRLPIFLYGIMFKTCSKSFKFVAGLGLLLYIPCRLYLSIFLASSLLSIPLILLCVIIMDRFSQTTFYIKTDKILSFIGSHTLELYIANLFIYWTVTCYDQLGIIERLVLYIGIQIMMSYIMIKIYKVIQKILF